MPRWQALMNISLPRKGDAEKQTDLIPTGDTFEAEEVRVTNLLHPKFGPPRIRRIEEQGQEMPRILPRMLSNRLAGPGPDARPDPSGSSRTQVLEHVPELTEPMPDSEERPAAQDAIDIPPRSRARTGQKAG